MDADEYRKFVAAAELEVARDPVALRRRVRGFVALGYVYVLGVIGVVVAALVLVVVSAATGAGGFWTWKVGLPLGALLVVILRALDVRFEPPTGVPVRPEDAPGFHQRVEEIRSAVDAPAPDFILLNEDFNASVTHLPERGLGGLPQTYLVIGVPMLYALTPEQFDAVLAHEFGHLSASHPKQGLRVGRMARIWRQLMTQLEEKQSLGSMFFDDFFQWYVPRLYAYGFAMSRGDEYEADADAARVTSAEAIGGALVALAVRGQYLEREFWGEIWAHASELPDPIDAWYSMPRRLRESDERPTRRESIQAALLASARENDTHPSLQDRLLRLGLLPSEESGRLAAADQLLVAMRQTAADSYFPVLASSRLEAMEQEWRAKATTSWTERFSAVRAMRERLVELNAQDEAGSDLSPEELWEVAAITSELSGDEAAVEATRRCLAAREENPMAHFLLGRALMARRDEECELHLKRAMELDPGATPTVSQMLFAIYQSRNDEASQQLVAQQFDAWSQMMREAHAERQHLQVDDRFTEPELDPGEIAAIQDAIDATEGIRDVLVARKITKHFPLRPIFLILLRPHQLTSARKDLVQRFTAALKPTRDVFIQLEKGFFERLAPVLEDAGAIRLVRQKQKRGAVGWIGVADRTTDENQSPA